MMLGNLTRIAVFSLALFSAYSVNGAEIELVKGGEPRAAIILPDDAQDSQLFAAEELRYHVQKASGADLSIYRESDLPVGHGFLIYVGSGNAAAAAGIDVEQLPPSGYVVKTQDNALYLVGRDRQRVSSKEDSSLYVGSVWAGTWQGSLYAVYDFLENEMGVRWLWPGELGEHIPQTDELVVENIDRKGGPNLAMAKWRSYIGRDPRQDPGRYSQYWFSGASYENFHKAQHIFQIRHRFGAVEDMRYGHAFDHYWKSYGETNPEFFNELPDGIRHPLPGDDTGRRISMCVSEPKFWAKIIDNWLENPRSTREDLPGYRPYVPALENDSPGMCTCERCRSWDAPQPEFKTHNYWGKGIIPSLGRRFTIARVSWGELGAGELAENNPPSLSDRYARFYVELLQKARDVDPNARVVGYAYANYWKSPIDRDLDLDGVIISYVPPLWFPYTEEMSAEFREHWNGWRELGADLIMRPNLTHAGANLPIFYARQLADDFSYAAERGMVATDFDGLLGTWSAQGPTNYTLSRLHHHPKLSADEILDEYYAAFGPAESGVREYFGYWERHSDSLDAEKVQQYGVEERGGGFKNYVRIAHRLFSPDDFKEARVLLEKARRQAEGDQLATRRVEFLEQGLTDAELTTATRAAQAELQKKNTTKSKAAFNKAFDQLVNHRKVMAMSGNCVADIGYTSYRERTGAGWPHQGQTMTWEDSKPEVDPTKENLALLEYRRLPWDSWSFSKDPQDRGEKEKWYQFEKTTGDWQPDAKTEIAWESFLNEPYVGAGWYRRSIEIPESMVGSSYFLHFGGVDETCRVWLNGTYIGEHDIGPSGWDIPFRLDITDALQSGENVMVVRVENTRAAGGIWRPIWLEIYEDK